MRKLLVRSLLGALVVEAAVAGVLIFDHLADDDGASALPGPVLTEAQSLTLPAQSTPAAAADAESTELLSTGEEEPSSVLVNLVNDYRIAAELFPLYVEPTLSAAASDYCGTIAPLQHQAHIGPDGRDWHGRAADAGYPGVGVIENLAWGYATPEEVAAAWQLAATESGNLLNADVNGIGVAHCSVESGDFRDWWVLMAGIGEDR